MTIDDERERIDLSTLDPSADPARWEGLIASIAERAVAARRRPNRIALQLADWARPALALAAMLAVAVWGAALADGAGSNRIVQIEALSEDPIQALSEWADRGEVPAAAVVLTLLGGDHDSP